MSRTRKGQDVGQELIGSALQVQSLVGPMIYEVAK